VLCDEPTASLQTAAIPKGINEVLGIAQIEPAP